MEEIKKKFIVQQNLEQKRIVEYTERLLPFCTITENGEVLITKKELKTLEKVKVALIARYLANRLESKISNEVSPDELALYLDVPKDQINARLKDARDDKFANTSDKGLSSVNPLRIGSFLEELEKKYGEC